LRISVIGDMLAACIDRMPCYRAAALHVSRITLLAEMCSLNFNVGFNFINSNKTAF